MSTFLDNVENVKLKKQKLHDEYSYQKKKRQLRRFYQNQAPEKQSKSIPVESNLAINLAKTALFGMQAQKIKGDSAKDQNNKDNFHIFKRLNQEKKKKDEIEDIEHKNKIPSTAGSMRPDSQGYTLDGAKRKMTFIKPP